jgi:hypothetical protein
VYADLFVRVTGSGQVCNAGQTRWTVRTDTNLANNEEQSCVDVQTCTDTQSCVGEIYGKNFNNTVNGSLYTSTVTCVVEATCGYGQEFTGVSAQLV